MTNLDYQARAELFLGSTWDTATTLGPRPFRIAAHAIRFAFEEAAVPIDASEDKGTAQEIVEDHHGVLVGPA